jgi:hypothetical protein
MGRYILVFFCFTFLGCSNGEVYMKNISCDINGGYGNGVWILKNKSYDKRIKFIIEKTSYRVTNEGIKDKIGDDYTHTTNYILDPGDERNIDCVEEHITGYDFKDVHKKPKIVGELQVGQTDK